MRALDAWGVRWIGELGDSDLDPHILMWDMRRTVPIDAWPRTSTVVEFRLSGVAAKASPWWLMVADGHADICDFDPGYDIDATITSSLRTLTRIWRGDDSWSRAVLDGSVTIDGPSDVRRAIPKWIGQAPIAAVPCPA